jgi:hypothetical protein
MMSAAIKWTAELAGVREVSLLGSADLDFWKRRLEIEGLEPAERDGHAQILVIAADLKFMGIRFRELSFSVLVSPPASGDWRNAAYLLGAISSFRFFAFCERLLFSTPYQHGDVSVSAALPVSIHAGRKDATLFRAQCTPTP